MREFSTKISDDGKYLHGEFKNLEYFHVLNNSIDTFEVKFVDEKYKQLRLSQGVKSFDSSDNLYFNLQFKYE